MKDLKKIFVPYESIDSKFLPQTTKFTSKYLINGKLGEWHGDLHQVISPIFTAEDDEHGHIVGTYPKMGTKEAMAALDAAVQAYNHGYGEWPAMSVAERINCMRKFVLMMKEQRDEIARLLMWEIGKSLQDSYKEFDRTVGYINDTIEALKDLDRSSSRFTISEGILAQIRRAPLGVVLCMGPFNYPLNETFTTLIPALIMGNTIVFKPPKLGVLLLTPLLNAFREAFPAGVVNTIYGRGKEVITPIMESGKVDVLAFIGSSKVADVLKKEHPHPHRLKCVLGLDAKNPAIILKDADLDTAVKETLLGSLSFNGQRCTALKIIFVHEDIAESYLQKLSEAVENLTIGLPWEDGVSITPLAEAGKPDYLTEMIADAVSKGATVVNPNGGKRYKSLFFPAILKNVNETMAVFREEQFGPIIPVVTFKDVDEPLNYVIGSNYGQQASIFGKDSQQIAHLIDILVNQVCRVNVNAQCQRGPDIFPFTGRKDSAEGTLSVSDALRVFSIRTLVATKGTDLNKEIFTEIVKDNKSKFLNTDFIF